MIEWAKSYNRFVDKVKYLLNESGELRAFSDRSFDLVYSNITLQHMKPRYSKRYIREFIRIAKPLGVVVFQLPCRRRKALHESSLKKVRRFVKVHSPSLAVSAYRRVRLGPEPPPSIEMHSVPLEDVAEIGCILGPSGELLGQPRLDKPPMVHQKNLSKLCEAQSEYVKRPV